MSEKTYTEIISNALYPAAAIASGANRDRLIRAIAADLGLEAETVYRAVEGGR